MVKLYKYIYIYIERERERERERAMFAIDQISRVILYFGQK